MDEEAVPYLGMAHAGRVLMALVLPFGLNIAPATFHKIMRELVRFLRVLKINVLNYLDDFLWSERWERVKELISFVRWLLPLLGWICNDKSVWEPAFVVTFFALRVQSATGQGQTRQACAEYDERASRRRAGTAC